MGKARSGRREEAVWCHPRTPQAPPDSAGDGALYLLGVEADRLAGSCELGLHPGPG